MISPMIPTFNAEGFLGCEEPLGHKIDPGKQTASSNIGNATKTFRNTGKQLRNLAMKH